MVTFSIGGMTGVLLAIPGADFVLHNSLFVIAHFHNVIIGGAVFGYIAGFAFWFPKAFGFKLNEKWGKAAFGFWISGFYVAFMPLYALGFMGMTRRLNTTENPEWTPYLYVAFVGAVLVAMGIACQLIQIYVSIRDREQNRDLTGDPWNGHTLEWSTSSPPPFYNFAELPKANEIDPFYAAKRDGEAYKVPAKYSDIHMPNNTATGLVMGALLTVFGFAMIWHIFWRCQSDRYHRLLRDSRCTRRSGLHGACIRSGTYRRRAARDPGQGSQRPDKHSCQQAGAGINNVELSI
jgi:cytochrome o ubiquinol oxidase subunit 1